jgi:hypothetical protein
MKYLIIYYLSTLALVYSDNKRNFIKLTYSRQFEYGYNTIIINAGLDEHNPNLNIFYDDTNYTRKGDEISQYYRLRNFNLNKSCCSYKFITKHDGTLTVQVKISVKIPTIDYIGMYQTIDADITGKCEIINNKPEFIREYTIDRGYGILTKCKATILGNISVNGKNIHDIGFNLVSAILGKDKWVDS